MRSMLQIMAQLMLVLVLAFSTLILATEIAQAAVDQQASAFVLCKSQKSVRTIRVTPDASQENCTITYSKNGKDETVGANRSLSSCKSVVAKIRDNLESANWNCREVSKATTTTSADISTQ